MNEMTKKEEIKMEEGSAGEEAQVQTTQTPEMSIQELAGQLGYAQKLIAILQNKLNDANGINIQLEAKLLMATEQKG